MNSRKRTRTADGSTDSHAGEDSSHQSNNESEEIQDPQFTKDEEFWFEDGNICLVSPRNIGFRVFQGILAAHSPVFKDMFSFPQPATSCPSLSGLDSSCPLVRLTDSAEDLRHILRVIMPSSSASPYFCEDPSFSMISATIRLGHKYQMLSLVDHSLLYLTDYFPSNFETCLALDSDSYLPSNWDPQSFIGVVNLARLTGDRLLLPAALLSCCTLDQTLLDGYRREDGTVEQLTLQDVALCFRARSALTKVRVAAALRIFDGKTSEQCTSTAQCQNLLRETLQDVDGLLRTPNPVAGYVPESTSMCFWCLTMVKEREHTEMAAAFKRVPELLGIGPVEGWDFGDDIDDDDAAVAN